jgi:hypothetical protein
MKKAMVANYSHFFPLLWSFWSSSLELRINNEMMVFLMLKVVMARKRILKKDGDLEAYK